MATLAADVSYEEPAREERFFGTLAILMALAIVAGFSMQWLAGRSTFYSPLRVHLHAVAFMGWVALFVAQSWLATRGPLALHRKLGWIAAASARRADEGRTNTLRNTVSASCEGCQGRRALLAVTAAVGAPRCLACVEDEGQATADQGFAHWESFTRTSAMIRCCVSADNAHVGVGPTERVARSAGSRNRSSTAGAPWSAPSTES